MAGSGDRRGRLLYCVVLVVTACGARTELDAARLVDAHGPAPESGSDAGADAGPRCPTGRVEIASGFLDSLAIAVDDSNVYVTTSDSIVAIPKCGGAPVTLASRQPGPTGLAVDATGVYWTNAGAASGAGTTGTVMKLPRGASEPLTLASGQSSPGTVVLGVSDVYWVEGEEGSCSSATGVGAIAYVLKAGGSPTTLASSLTNAEGLATNGRSLYWTTGCGFGPSLLGIPIAGGTLAVVDEGLALTAAVVADESNVYGVEGLAIVRMPLDGSLPVTLANDQANPKGLVTDGKDLYWTNATDGHPGGSVVKVAKTGGAPVTLARREQVPWAIAVDATSVYWTDGNANTVLELTPK